MYSISQNKMEWSWSGKGWEQITQGPGGVREEPGFLSHGVGALGGFSVEADLSCLLPPQAGYPAPGHHLAEELQENRECPEWGEVGRRRQRKLFSLSSLDCWVWAHLLSPETFTDGSFARHFLNTYLILSIVLVDETGKTPALMKLAV